MRAPDTRRAQRGLSLIELMVGIVVSLLVGLAATGSAMMFNASQRQGIGAGSTTVNAASVMNGIKADASLAGLGFFDDSAPMCATLNLSTGATVLINGAAFAPVQATREGSHDRVDVMYASTIEAGTAVLLDSPSDTTGAELRSLLTASAGQAVLMAPSSGAGACTVRSVTAVAASTPTTPQTLTFGGGGTHNDAAFATPATYVSGSRVTLLGQVRWHRYRVDGEQLLLERPAEGTSALLMRNVIAFRLQYGVSATATSTTLDSWVDASGDFATLTSANLPRVRAVRLGVLVRSNVQEKADEAGECSATTTLPTLFGTTPSALASETTWKCFRYRTSIVTVPLRNFVI